MISPLVKIDTKKLESFEEFVRVTSANPPAAASSERGRARILPLKEFAAKRRAYLLSYQPKPAASGSVSR